jgi:hypothetical protein
MNDLYPFGKQDLASHMAVKFLFIPLIYHYIANDLNWIIGPSGRL